VLKNRLGGVSSEQVAREELADELDVTEELVLALEHHFLVVILRVFLAGLLGLGLQRLEVVHLEDLLEAAAAVVEQLFAELAELEVVRVRFLALGLEVDFDDGSTDLLRIELRVLVLDLGLAEDRLNNDAKDLVVNLEVLSGLWVEAFLTEELTVADQHVTELGNFTIDIILSDLIQNQTNALNLILRCFSLSHHLLSILGELGLEFESLLVSWALVKAATVVATVVVTATATAGVRVGSAGLETATVAATSATSIVVAALVLARGTVETATLLLIDERLLLAVVTARNNAAVHAHFNQVFRLLGDFAHLSDEGLEELDAELLLSLDLVDGLLDTSDFLLVLACELVTLDVGVAALDDTLDHEHVLLLGRLNWLGGLLRHLLLLSDGLEHRGASAHARALRHEGAAGRHETANVHVQGARRLEFSHLDGHGRLTNHWIRGLTVASFRGVGLGAVQREGVAGGQAAGTLGWDLHVGS